MTNHPDSQTELETWQRRVEILRGQAAHFGPYTPPHIILEIQDLEKKIAGITGIPPIEPASYSSSPPATRRPVYAIAGMVIGALVNIAINLLSSAIQQTYFFNQFSANALWGLAIFIVMGLLLGMWLGGEVKIPVAPQFPSPDFPAEKPPVETITRLNALFSYAKLRGKGIRLSDILLIASKLDIDVKE